MDYFASGQNDKVVRTNRTEVITSAPVTEVDLQPCYQIDPFMNAQFVLPEMKQSLAVRINRSSHVDT